MDGSAVRHVVHHAGYWPLWLLAGVIAFIVVMCILGLVCGFGDDGDDYGPGPGLW